MATAYIGADVDSKMTELAVERNGEIVCRERVPTSIVEAEGIPGRHPWPQGDEL